MLSCYFVLWPGSCSKLSCFKWSWNWTFLKKLCPFNMKECAEGLKKGVLRNFAKFTGKRMCQSLLISAILTNTWSFSTSNRLESLSEIVFLENAATSIQDSTVSTYIFYVIWREKNTTFSGEKIHSFMVFHISVLQTH